MKLRFAIAESLEETYTNLTKRLREAELDWEMKVENSEPYFTTKFNNIEVVVKEKSVILNSYANDGTHETRRKDLKRKSELYLGLSRRFNEDGDFRFYTGVVNCLAEMMEGENEPDNNSTSGTIVS